MDKEKFNEALTYTLKHPFEAMMGASLYVVAMSAGVSVFIYAVNFGYVLVTSALPS